jgi:hypothetical protein
MGTALRLTHCKILFWMSIRDNLRLFNIVDKTITCSVHVLFFQKIVLLAAKGVQPELLATPLGL